MNAVECNGECGICLSTCFYHKKRERYSILWNRQLPDFNIVGYSIFHNGDMVAVFHNDTFINLTNTQK